MGLGVSRVGALRPTVGVAVLERGDGRALDVGLASLMRQDAPPDEIVMVRQLALSRRDPAPISVRHGVAETLEVRSQNARNVAIDRLGGHDIAVLVPEGLTLDRTTLSDLVRRFAAAPRLVGLMLTSRRCVPHRRLPPAAAMFEPERLIRDLARSRPAGASRYFAPALLALAPARARPLRFETFASRSDWASGRLFLDAAAALGEVVEAETDGFAFIGAAPDRRGGVGQGERCYEALAQLAAAYPHYRDFARADLRRLVAEQLRALALEPDRKATRAFLAGMWSRFGADLALRRRLKRDIRHLG